MFIYKNFLKLVTRVRFDALLEFLKVYLACFSITNWFTAMIKQFLHDVYWQDIDYLIIDTPPGTSDEHITVMENVRCVY
jgi:hypothetical protein